MMVDRKATRVILGAPMTNRFLCAALLATMGCVDAADPAAAPETIAITEGSHLHTPHTPAAFGGTWQPLTNASPAQASMMLLLTDGTVMVSDQSTTDWWRLTPDINGSYLNGAWTKRASAPGGYAPLYFSSAVLPDGRVIVMGGEYQANAQAFTKQGAIYDPVANTWKAVAAPPGWTMIGDGQSIVLPNGQFMMADCCENPSDEALLDAATLTWSPTGTGKEDSNDEEGWTLLPDDTLLTVDANNTAHPDESEQYLPEMKMWVSAGSVGVHLADLDPDGSGSHELGPAVLRPDGTVLATGATGHNAVYNTATKTWAAAPDFPSVAAGPLDVADGPAALLPNGNVLIAASPGVFISETHFFEWDGAAMNEVAQTPSAPQDPSYTQNFLVLPTGEVLLSDATQDVELYTPVPASADVAAPIITGLPKLISAADPDPFILTGLDGDVEDAHSQNAIAAWTPEAGTPPVVTIHPARSYRIDGRQFNGISQAVAYGDDGQGSTNYPMVRVTNMTSGHVSYCRSHDGSSYSIKPGTESSTTFDVPGLAEPGLAKLEIVANGIPSPAILVNIK